MKVVEGVWWIDLVSVCKDREDSEPSINRADVDFFNIGTKLCRINKSGSGCGENMDNSVVLPAKAL